jgi:hypothetical protein
MIKINYYQIRNGYNYTSTPFEHEIPCEKEFYWDGKGMKPDYVIAVEDKMKQITEKIAKENKKKPEDIFFIFTDTLKNG